VAAAYRVEEEMNQKPPGFYEGLKAIENWLDEIYPIDVFGDGDIAKLKSDIDVGVKAINAIRWATEQIIIPDDTEPAHFYSCLKEPDDDDT